MSLRPDWYMAGATVGVMMVGQSSPPEKFCTPEQLANPNFMHGLNDHAKYCQHCDNYFEPEELNEDEECQSCALTT